MKKSPGTNTGEKILRFYSMIMKIEEEIPDPDTQKKK
jgi:hypothetical protein